MHSAPSPLAVRVANRHLADSPGAPDRGTIVILSDGGVITPADIARLLVDRVGRLANLRFGDPDPGDRHPVPWQAVTEDREVITGRLLLHAAASSEAVPAWGTIEVDGQDGQDGRTVEANEDERDHDGIAALEEIAQRGRELIQKYGTSLPSH